MGGKAAEGAERLELGPEEEEHSRWIEQQRMYLERIGRHYGDSGGSSQDSNLIIKH